MPDRISEAYLEVKEVATGEVVTVIEVLSPTNKRAGEGRELYLKKRSAALGSRTSLVEIDLLRTAAPMPIVGAQPSSDYRILVSRGDGRPMADLYPFSLRDPIPRFRVPLKHGDPLEPELDLGRILHDLYEAVGYDLAIDYRDDPEPCLARRTDRAWAARVLRKAGLKR
jgi:hypothetical protein